MSKPFSFSTPLGQYKTLIWHGQPIFSRYALIKNHLRANLDDDIADMLAEPLIPEGALKGKADARWVSIHFTIDGARRYEELSATEKAAAYSHLTPLLRQVDDYVDQLKKSADREARNWGE
ncbi:MAG: hypothetical protein AAFO69_17670, partial [Bacteroidota bacterium]